MIYGDNDEVRLCRQCGKRCPLGRWMTCSPPCAKERELDRRRRQTDIARSAAACPLCGKRLQAGGRGGPLPRCKDCYPLAKDMACARKRRAWLESHPWETLNEEQRAILSCYTVVGEKAPSRTHRTKTRREPPPPRPRHGGMP